MIEWNPSSKIYTGYKFMIEGVEYAVIGNVTIRKSTSYILKNIHDEKRSITRNSLIEGLQKGSIQYV